MSLLDYFFGTADLQAQSDALDAQNQELTQQRYDQGQYSDDWLARSNAQQGINTADRQSGTGQNVSNQINAAFDQGLQEGANNVSSFVSGTFNAILAPVKAVLKGVPWWVWIGAAVALFLWLGGGEWLAKKTRGVLK